MIKIICGPKGSGKTKRIIDTANSAISEAKGHLIFITDTKRYMYDLRREIRFIDVTDYSVAGEDALCGFIKGTIAGNYDNEYVFVDGVARIAGTRLPSSAGSVFTLHAVARKRIFPILRRNICNRETGFFLSGEGTPVLYRTANLNDGTVPRRGTV